MMALAIAHRRADCGQIGHFGAKADLRDQLDRLAVGAKISRHADVHQEVALLDRPHPSTDSIARLKHGYREPALLEAIGRRHSGHPAADNGDRSAGCISRIHGASTRLVEESFRAKGTPGPGHA